MQTRLKILAVAAVLAVGTSSAAMAKYPCAPGYRHHPRVCQAATAPKARVRARRAGFGGRLAEASPDLTLPSPVRPRGRRGEISVGRAVGRSAHALARKRVQGAASTGAARALSAQIKHKC